MHSTSPKRSSSDVSKEEAAQCLNTLQRSASVKKEQEQQEQQSSEAFTCWARDDDEPTSHTSRCMWFFESS
jgi:hypothetical protein